MIYVINKLFLNLLYSLQSSNINHRFKTQF